MTLTPEQTTKMNTPAPEGFKVVRSGKSQPGDLKWCGDHGWEEAGEGSEYWSYLLLVRPE